MKKTILFSTLAILVFMTRCEKEESTPSTPEDIIASKTWVVKAKTVEPSLTFGAQKVSVISMLDSTCIQDNTYSFKKDGTFTLGGGAEICPGSSDITTTWAFNAEKNKITLGKNIVFYYPFIGAVAVNSVDIAQLTTSNISATFPFDYEGATYKVTITFEPI